MSKSYYLPPNVSHSARVMVFVDGENLAIRYGKLLDGSVPPNHVVFERDVFVWSPFANIYNHSSCEVVRRHYYTCVQGDALKCDDIEDQIKQAGIEAPRVFKKVKGIRSKRVDISLTTEMLMHAHRGNYDIAILVAGDEDYVPLVDAVMAEGRRVVVWFFENGLSPALRKRSDHYFDISTFLLKDDSYLAQRYSRFR